MFHLNEVDTFPIVFVYLLTWSCDSVSWTNSSLLVQQYDMNPYALIQQQIAYVDAWYILALSCSPLLNKPFIFLA